MDNLMYPCGQIFYKLSNNDFILICSSCNAENFDDYDAFKKHFQQCYSLKKNLRMNVDDDSDEHNAIFVAGDSENHQEDITDSYHRESKNVAKEISSNSAYDIHDLSDQTHKNIANEENIAKPKVFTVSIEGNDYEIITSHSVDHAELNNNNNDDLIQNNNLDNVQNSSIELAQLSQDSQTHDSQCIEIYDSDDDDDDRDGSLVSLVPADEDADTEAKSVIDITDDDYSDVVEEQPIFDCDSSQVNSSSAKANKKMSKIISHANNGVECKICEKNFENVSALKSHHQECHTSINSKFYRCTECELSFSKEQSLNNHKKIAHNMDVLKMHAKEKKKYSTLYKNKNILNTEIRFFLNDEGGGAPPDEQSLKQSEDSNNENDRSVSVAEQVKLINRRFCKYCGKKFKHFHHVIAHEQKHVQRKVNECLYCCKTFVKKMSLIDHERTVHTKETPFKCGFCARTFTTSLKRDNHQNTHTGERPYKCSECDQSFMTSTRKYRHMITAHPSTARFKCRFCTKAFESSSLKQEHENEIHLNLLRNLQNASRAAGTLQNVN